jgi:RNA polymerase sigma-70 factor (ECF subfamily)
MRPEGDVEATRKQYLALLEKHAPALRRLCHSYCEGHAESQDLFPEIALALWTALPRFRGESSERTWLYRVAHNVARTFAARAATKLVAEKRELERLLEHTE